MTTSPFDRIDLAGAGTVTIAYSGGGDSTALLAAFAAWAREHKPQVRIEAVTVDHRLRPESGKEAAAAGEFCRHLGIAHRILQWTDPKPSRGLQEAAREARYRLLGDAARAAGSSIVLTGHTRDDQRETVSMRRERGEGRGLAGIAAATLAFDSSGEGRPVWFVRPLLDESRAGLRQYLLQKGIGWKDDPSNENPAFERVRARDRLAQLSAGEAEALDRIANDASQERRAQAGEAAALVDAHFRPALPGTIGVDRAFRAVCASAAGTHALATVLAFMGGLDQLPTAARVRKMCEALCAGAGSRHSLARCVIDAMKPDITIRRERRRDAEIAQSGAGATGTLPRRLHPWPDLLPEFDYQLAQAIARLAGMADLPNLPWKGRYPDARSTT